LTIKELEPGLSHRGQKIRERRMIVEGKENYERKIMKVWQRFTRK
jgi:hypothetical protein